MPFPALQNRTVRLLIVSLASIGALATVVGSATLSYRQAYSAAIVALEEKTEMWGDAVASLITDTQIRLESLERATSGTASTATADALRRLVAESPLYRSAILIEDGQVVCSDAGLAETPIPAPAEFLELGPVGDIRLAGIHDTENNQQTLAINYNPGRNHSFTVIVPTPGISELMRYGDRKSEYVVYFTDATGSIFDASVNAPPGKPELTWPPVSGLSRTAGNISFTREIAGFPYFVTATLPREALMVLWTRNLPLYGVLAITLATCFFIAAWVASAQTRTLESELREAARLRQIVAHYQPIMNLQTGKCAGVEVLMRWRHPERGLIPPLAFIPEAERTGVITELTECLMIEAMGELEPLLNSLHDFHAAINIPVQTLTNPAFPAHVDRLIQRRFSYSQLSFELTESTSLTESAVLQLGAMKDLGIRLAVDDFGTGYSNLRYLSMFPFDFLKIDKAFVDGISADGQSSGFVDQIIAIGRACGLQLIAEGIEYSEQAVYLKSAGVEFGQGFFFAAPMTIAELRVWLEKQGGTAKG